jgi:hypothetical protein
VEAERDVLRNASRNSHLGKLRVDRSLVGLLQLGGAVPLDRELAMRDVIENFPDLGLQRLCFFRAAKIS